MAVDAAHVYWTNIDANTIGRANLDGTGANQRFITTASSPYGVAVDAAHVYWTNTDTIGRSNLDGSGVNQRFITAASNSTYGVAVDAAHVYWTNEFTGTIGRSNLDGSDANQRFITGASGPFGVAVDALLLPPPPPPPGRVVKAPRISVAGVASSRCRRANFRAHLTVSDALKLKRVDVVLDGRRIVHTHAKHVGARVAVARLRAGSHTLKIIATDAAGKTRCSSCTSPAADRSRRRPSSRPGSPAEDGNRDPPERRRPGSLGAAARAIEGAFSSNGARLILEARQVGAEGRVWRMTAEQRVAAMYRGELSFHQLCAWSSRYPDQVPVLDGELWFLAVLTPELADARTPNIAALPTRADPVAVAEAAWEKACDAETAAWEAYYEHGAPRAEVDAATLATDTAELELRRARRAVNTPQPAPLVA